MPQAFNKSAEELSEADIVTGNTKPAEIPALVKNYLKSNKRILNIENHAKDEVFNTPVINSFEERTRAFMKIEDGCERYCTYCIIPYVRGDIRSKKEKDVINEVTTLVNNGYKEIVLTGIHTGKYGKDINSSLEHLLNELVSIPNIYRIRLSSIEINEITDGIIKLIKENKVMAKHLHIPLQSGSDKILSLMGRRYDLNFFKEKIKEIRNNIPDISITTDLILGFPGENEEDYQETLNTLNEIKFY
jgi:threonylcarbamoyladenosine tRNA methylthiotransferase MtaB